jgi:hypothetical protein
LAYRNPVAASQYDRRADAAIVNKGAVPAAHIDETVLSYVGTLDHAMSSRNRLVLYGNLTLIATAEFPNLGGI